MQSGTFAEALSPCLQRLAHEPTVHPSRRALASVTFVVLAAVGCSAEPTTHSVLVHANDYAFTVADSLPAGPTAFGLSNTGAVPHELIIVRLRPGADVQELLRLEAAGGSSRELRDPPAGILTADPGTTTPGQLLLTLQAGERYLMVCNFQDSVSAPLHLQLGMLKLITVHEARAGT